MEATSQDGHARPVQAAYESGHAPGVPSVYHSAGGTGAGGRHADGSYLAQAQPEQQQQYHYPYQQQYQDQHHYQQQYQYGDAYYNEYAAYSTEHAAGYYSQPGHGPPQQAPVAEVAHAGPSRPAGFKFSWKVAVVPAQEGSTPAQHEAACTPESAVPAGIAAEALAVTPTVPPSVTYPTAHTQTAHTVTPTHPYNDLYNDPNAAGIAGMGWHGNPYHLAGTPTAFPQPAAAPTFPQPGAALGPATQFSAPAGYEPKPKFQWKVTTMPPPG